MVKEFLILKVVLSQSPRNLYGVAVAPEIFISFIRVISKLIIIHADQSYAET